MADSVAPVAAEDAPAPAAAASSGDADAPGVAEPSGDSPPAAEAIAEEPSEALPEAAAAASSTRAPDGGGATATRTDVVTFEEEVRRENSHPLSIFGVDADSAATPFFPPSPSVLLPSPPRSPAPPPLYTPTSPPFFNAPLPSSPPPSAGDGGGDPRVPHQPVGAPLPCPAGPEGRGHHAGG